MLGLVEPELDALKHKVRFAPPLWFASGVLTRRSCSQNWLLDGFPRKASQAVLLDNLLAKYGDELNFVANLAVPDEVILQRIEGAFCVPLLSYLRLTNLLAERWVHPASGRVYNVRPRLPTPSLLSY